MDLNPVAVTETLAVVLHFISFSKLAHENNIFTIFGNNTRKKDYYLD